MGHEDSGLRSEDAVELLKKFGPNKFKKKDTIPMPVTVVRDGRLRPLMPIDLVPGDICQCSEGQLVLADIVIISFGIGCGEVIISDSHLTYVSGGDTAKPKKIGDKCFYGTVVCAGNFYGRVEATGKNTAMCIWQKSNKSSDKGGFGKLFDTGSKSWFKKKTTKEIPGSVDPVLTYPLPRLGDFLNEPSGAKYFKKVLDPGVPSHAYDCFFETEGFKKNPSLDAAKIIYDRFVGAGGKQKLPLSAKVVGEIDDELASLKRKPTPGALDRLQHSALEYMMPAWSSFRTRPEFNEWLHDAKHTSVDQLNKEWWKKYRNSKWAHTGKKGSKDSRKSNFELDGNAILKPSRLPANKKALNGQYAMVFWPVDNLSRLCHILAYTPQEDCFQVQYFFDGKAYDEHFDTDWKIIEMEKEAALDYRGSDVTGSNTNSLLSRDSDSWN